MKNILIIGARGWGREVYASFREHYKDYKVKGFLDDNAEALNDVKGDYPPIISSVEDYLVQPDDVFFCALGDPVCRRRYANIIEEKGGEFISCISARAVVNPTAVIEKGSYIGAGVVISDNVAIGKHAIIQSYSVIGHDVKVADFVSLEAFCFIGGYAEIGECTSIHVRSTVLHYKKIGKNASVGAVSLVMRNVKDYAHVFGIPAKKIPL